MDLQLAIEKLLSKLHAWGEELVVLTPNLLGAVLLVILAWLVARLVRRGLSKAVEPVLPTQIGRLLASIAYLATIATGVFVALGVLNLEKTVTSLLAGAGIIGLALGFAFQDIAANFMSGILLAFRQPFVIGELIETNDFFGQVERITLRSTQIGTPEGQMVLVPNRKVFESPIVNYSRNGRRRVDLKVGVAYGDDLDKARSLAIGAVEKVEGREPSQPVELFYEEFGDSSINFVVRFWVEFKKSQAPYLNARSEAIERIKSAFDQGGITIPFPIRTLDFGVVGGEPLADELRKLPRLGGSE